MKIREAIALIAQRVKPLESLTESGEEEEGERIAPAMSSFLDADEDEAEKDTATTTLVPKDSTPPVVDKTGTSSLGFEWITAAMTPSAIMTAKDIGSSKPALAEDNRKGSAECEEAKQAIEDDTPLGERSFNQDLGGRR